MKTQEQLFYSACENTARGNELFLEMVKDGLTKSELEKLICKRPELWDRFDGWLDKLPSDPDKPSCPCFVMFGKQKVMALDAVISSEGVFALIKFKDGDEQRVPLSFIQPIRNHE